MQGQGKARGRPGDCGGLMEIPRAQSGMVRHEERRPRCVLKLGLRSLADRDHPARLHRPTGRQKEDGMGRPEHEVAQYPGGGTVRQARLPERLHAVTDIPPYKLSGNTRPAKSLCRVFQ